MRCYEIRPEQFGLSPAPPEAVRGGDVADNVALARRVLAGEPGPPADLVALNAGAARVVAGAAREIGEGVARARRCLRDGAAAACLERLRQASQAVDGDAS